jgi:methionyl-tRNA formyltransferase
MKGGVVLLGGRYPSTNVIYNHLRKRVQIQRVVLESRRSRFNLLRKRAARLGAAKAIGQACFRALIVPTLQIAAFRRIRDLKHCFQLDDTSAPGDRVVSIRSVNDPEIVQVLRDLDPAVVVVNGTRLIASDILRSLRAPLVNLHAGVTPLYRGVHGAYWALVEGDAQNCGVTLHLIDDGIDTGPVLRQARIQVTPRDNFATYPWLQVAAALPLLDAVLDDLLGGRAPSVVPTSGNSRLWTHPTMFEYMGHRIARGVK